MDSDEYSSFMAANTVHLHPQEGPSNDDDDHGMPEVDSGGVVDHRVSSPTGSVDSFDSFDNTGVDQARFPVGIKFNPSDRELVNYYLRRKARTRKSFPQNMIVEVEFYKYTPQELSEMYPSMGDGEWYFFTSRDRKYRNGNRPNRAAGSGFWKATGADKPVSNTRGVITGYKKTLVYYAGKPPSGIKTSWIMHEFRLEGLPAREREHDDDMKLDDCVLCRIYYKVENICKSTRKPVDQCVTESPQDLATSAEPEDHLHHDHSVMTTDYSSTEVAGEMQAESTQPLQIPSYHVNAISPQSPQIPSYLLSYPVHPPQSQYSQLIHPPQSQYSQSMCLPQSQYCPQSMRLPQSHDMSSLRPHDDYGYYSSSIMDSSSNAYLPNQYYWPTNGGNELHYSPPPLNFSPSSGRKRE